MRCWTGARKSFYSSHTGGVSVLEFQELVEKSHLPLGRWEKLPKVMQMKPKIAVAMSGGAHSSCLAILLSRWRAEHKAHAKDAVDIIGFTVDHNLEDSMCSDASAVHMWDFALIMPRDLHQACLSITGRGLGQRIGLPASRANVGKIHY